MNNLEVLSFSKAKSSGTNVSLSEGLFSLTPNIKLIKHVLDWQRGKARAGTHKTKNISEVSGTGRKPHAQKGLGRARKGTLRANQMRGGAIVHGPVVRSYRNTRPPKKIRVKAVEHLLSSKAQSGKMVLFDDFTMDKISTKLCNSFLKSANISSALVCIDRSHKEFKLSSTNIPNIKVVFIEGINVLDLLKYEYFVTCTEVLKNIENNKKI